MKDKKLKDEKLKEVLEESFGLADRQNLEEFEAAEKETTEADRRAGNYEALKNEIEKRENNPKE